MKLSLSEHLVLGILAEQARHGYDIEKVITERGMRKWTDIGFSSIYYVLDKLETKELVVSINSRGKEKKQYLITEKGIVMLKVEAKNLIAERKPANTHLMTGLATSHLIEEAEFARLLEQRKAELISDLRALQNKRLAVKDAAQSAHRLFNLSEVLLEAELSWIEKEIERMTI
ncbi:MAG: PadR family transcriptional regulator [Deinococcaceae bacterium]